MKRSIHLIVEHGISRQHVCITLPLSLRARIFPEMDRRILCVGTCLSIESQFRPTTARQEVRRSDIANERRVATSSISASTQPNVHFHHHYCHAMNVYDLCVGLNILDQWEIWQSSRSFEFGIQNRTIPAGVYLQIMRVCMVKISHERGLMMPCKSLLCA